jgi:ABC-type multidrug transport system fused ATPase/permease subunit
MGKITSKSREAVLYFLRLRPGMVMTVIALGIVYSLSETFSIGMLLPLLSQLTGSSAVYDSRGGIVAYLFKISEIIPAVSPIIATLLIFFAATLFKNILGYAKEVFSTFLGLSVREHCQAALFNRLLRADYSFFYRQRVGDLEYRVITAPNQMNNLISIIPDIATETLKCLLIISLLFLIAPEITVIVVIVGCLFIWLIRYISSRVSYFTGKGRVQASSDAAVYCGQALRGIKMLRIFRAERFWENLFHNSLNRFYSLAKRDVVFTAAPARLLETIVFGIISLVIGWMVVSHGSSDMIKAIPVFGIFVLAMQRLLPSLNSIGRNSMLFMSSLPYGEATYNAMTESFENAVDSGKLPARFESDIVFDDVFLKYDSSDKSALNGISFSLKKNRTVAIVGESGSGKTSALNLILKVLEPTGGSILVDGVPLKDINTDEWYSRIGYVGQEVFMFNGTVRDNVLFGVKGYSDEDIYAALEMANAAEFVKEGSRGLDTAIGDDGIRLSGGQRQRLAIARALLRKPDMLILDEATSAVDNISEKLIKDTVKKLHEQMTIINVAHRFSTISDADEIIVLKNGEVIETGSFAELLQKGRYFKKLYNIQGDENGLPNIPEERVS